jgi:hypothetical protein
MKTFRNYILESTFTKKGKDFVHSERIGEQKVDILYNRKTGAQKDYDVNFYVNSSPLKSSHMNAKNGIKILRHVHSSLNDFITSNRPSSLTFTSAEPEKHSVYTKISKKIAKKHDGKHEEYTNSNKIYF